jgi:hypothetical protein
VLEEQAERGTDVVLVVGDQDRDRLSRVRHFIRMPRTRSKYIA